MSSSHPFGRPRLTTTTGSLNPITGSLILSTTPVPITSVLTTDVTTTSVTTELKKHDDVLHKIADLMEEGCFRDFFDKYFSGWSDIKAMIMLMKTYQLVQTSIPENFRSPLDKKDIVRLMRTMLMNQKYRGYIVESMDKFMSSDTDECFVSICRNIMRSSNVNDVVIDKMT